MDFESRRYRKAVQAMIAEVEGKPCVNFGEYDGGVYVCRRISGLVVDEDGCLYGNCEWVDREDARPGELTDGMAIGFDCLRNRPRLVPGHLFRVVLRVRAGARGPVDGRGSLVGEGVYGGGRGQGLRQEEENVKKGPSKSDPSSQPTRASRPRPTGGASCSPGSAP